jgi:hypothetical protein
MSFVGVMRCNLIDIMIACQEVSWKAKNVFDIPHFAGHILNSDFLK